MASVWQAREGFSCIQPVIGIRRPLALNATWCPDLDPWQEATRMWWVANRMGRRVLAVLGHRLDGPLSRESRKPLRNEVKAMGAHLVCRSLGKAECFDFGTRTP